jgi:hypothetical protein
MTRDDVAQTGKELRDLEARAPVWARTGRLAASTVTRSCRVEAISKTMQIIDP